MIESDPTTDRSSGQNPPVLMDRIPAAARCPECGYHLAGLASNTCPECGTPISIEDIERRRPTGLVILCIAGLFVSGFILSATAVLSVIGVPMMLGAVALAGSWPHADGPRVRFWLKWAVIAVWVPTAAALIGLVWAFVVF